MATTALEPPLIQAALAGPLGGPGTRQRVGTRIGATRVGPGLFSFSFHSEGCVADWDACWVDRKPIQTLAQWKDLLARNRIGDVTGPFALAWISAEGQVHLTRDPIGERTLFYALNQNGIVFASTIRDILATGQVEPRLSLVGIATYLSYAYVPGRETLIEGIFEVLPGEMVTFQKGEITRTCTWRPPEEREIADTDEETLKRDLLVHLEDAVQRRLPHGEPVGAFLSGGLDSSLVVALATKLHDSPVRTYSVSFGAGYRNELPFSTLVARHCQTNHRVVELSPEVVARYLDQTIGLLSDPIGDPLTVPNALLFREGAKEVGVVLNGEGGDPCFGGPKNLPMLLSELYGDPHEREHAYLRAHQKCYDDLERMLTDQVRDAIRGDVLVSRLKPWFENPRWRQFVTKLQAINVVFKGGHHILPKVDALSAISGVVARSPLFDRAVVEASFALPPQLKLRGSVEKYLLKRCAEDLLPREIIHRPKSGMLVPVEGWFQGPLLSQARERILDGLAPYELFNRSYLEQLLEGRLGGLRPRHGVKIWLLITLEAWLRTHGIKQLN